MNSKIKTSIINIQKYSLSISYSIYRPFSDKKKKGNPIQTSNNYSSNINRRKILILITKSCMKVSIETKEYQFEENFNDDL